MSGHGIPRVSGDREKDNEKENRRIAAYSAMVNEIQKRYRAQDCSNEALDLTSRLLVKNPEYYTIWNFRRQILQHLISEQTTNAMNMISADLQFLVPLLLQYPKCYWIWNYRMWLLQQMKETLEVSDTLKLWNGEINLVSKMLVRDERNFHGWDYRRHVIAQMEKFQGSQEQSLVESEFQYSTRMIQKALHNFSALHYRSKLIPRLLAERNASPIERRQFLEQELCLMQDAMIDPFNQSAWFYHQYLMTCITANYPTTAAIVSDFTPEERVKYFDREIVRIREILEDYDDCKWVYQALLQYHVDADRLHDASDADLSFWLQELKRLDPMRANRWHAVASRIAV